MPQRPEEARQAPAAEVRLTYFPNPVLRRPSRLASAEEIADKYRVEQMFEAMNSKNGVGIAAPQIGVPIQACIIRVVLPGQEPSPKANGTVMFNPEIMEGGTFVDSREGCLSCPGIVATVRRKDWIRVRWTDTNGMLQEMRFGDYAAKIVQHEIDHLNGLTIVDKMSQADRAVNARPLRLMEMMAKKIKETVK